MSTELIKQFLEAGVHFGHKASRWNPKMKKFIFGERSSIYIIDLEKTEECLNKARDFLLDVTAKGGMVLFAGTKRQAQEIIKQEAIRCGMYYVSVRWPGGLLTNFSTIKNRINRLKEIEKMRQDGTFDKLNKKEIARLEKELDRLKKDFSGIVPMERMPAAIFVVDTKKEETAVREANRLSIPIIGVIDTNSNPDVITYPIPANDDATKSIRLISRLIADTIIEGRQRFLSYLSESSVAIKPGEENEAPPVILPEEEIKIKEIEEVVETSEFSEGTKSVKKGRPRQTPEEKNRLKKKV